MGLGDYVAVPYSSLDPDGDILKDEYLDVYQMMDVRGSDVLDDLVEKGLVKANPKRGSSADKKEAFQDFLNRGGSQLVAQAPSQPALDADGKPMEGTSMGVPIFGGAIPGTMVGNMQGVLTGYPQPQTNTMFGPVTPGTFAGKQLYPLLIPRR